MSEIQLYQGQLVYPTDAGEMRPVPVEVARDFLPIMQAYVQGQIAPHVYQNACDYVMQRSQELELVGQIAGQAIASHQAVNVELAQTIRAMAENRQQQPTEAILVYENPNLAAVLWTGIVSVLIILGAIVVHAVATSPKPNAPVPVQQSQGFI